MKITKLTASFGRLEKETLELAPGLNIIQAPNEGGKSTWAAFLRVMLYGIDTRERDKKGTIADKNRFRPWSGAPMEGVLECDYQGRPIVLRRYTKGNSPMGAFSAAWADTGEPVEGMTGENAGELLTGVGRDVFERSAFLRQSGLAVDQAPELERRITALVTTGQEDVSCSQADGRLREWLRRRKYNKSGQIPRLEEELAETEATLRSLDHATARIAAARAEAEGLNAQKSELERDMEIHQRLAQRELNQRYAAAREALDKALAEEESVRAALHQHGAPPTPEALREAQDELACLKAVELAIHQQREEPEPDEHALMARCRDMRFPDLSLDEMWETAQQDAETLLSIRAARAARDRWTIPVVVIAALVGLLVGGLLWYKYPDLILLAVVGGLCVPAFVNSIRRTVYRQAEEREMEEVNDILVAHQVTDEEEVIPKAKHILEDAQAARTELKALLQRRAEAEAARKEREGRTAALLGFVHTFAPEASDLFGVAAAISRALTLLDKQKVAALRRESAQQLADTLAAQGGQLFDTLEMLCPPALDRDATAARLGAVNTELSRIQSALDTAQGERKALGDPAHLMAQADSLRERLDQLRRDHAALEIALDALHAADSQLRGRISPALNQRAGELMAILTGGRYDKVVLDRALEATAEEAGGLVPRPAPALSQGTADQLYLAVRLAICQLVLPGADPCPLVLDDALTNFDDGRMALALELLRKLAEDRQILLFTCHSREGAYFAGDGEVHTLILSG